MSAGSSTRAAPGRPFPPGVSGNPSGRSKEIAAVEALARTKSAQAITELMRIAKGRGMAAVRAIELVLSYGLGRPQHQLQITARGTPLDGRFAGAVRAALEGAIAQAEGHSDAATDMRTVALAQGATDNQHDSTVIDVEAVATPAARGHAMASDTDEPGSI
jgi:hypothetical protein